MKADEALLHWIEKRLLPVSCGEDSDSTAVEDRISLLPRETRDEMGRVVDRILLEPFGGRFVDRKAATIPDAVLEPLREVLRSLVQQRPLAMVYRSESGNVSERRVEPQGILMRPPLWYVLSYDRTKDAGRTFRLDRVEAISPMLGTFRLRDLDKLFDGLENTIGASGSPTR